MKQVLTGVALVGSVVLLSACGAQAPSEEEQPGSVQSAKEAFTEVNCQFAPHDDVMDDSFESMEFGSASGSTYGHPGCSNAYIVDFTISAAGSHINSSYNGPPADGVQFPCNSTWVRRRVFANSGLLLDDSTAFGTGSTSCKPPLLQPFSAQHTTYRVLSQAGFITALKPVAVEVCPQPFRGILCGF